MIKGGQLIIVGKTGLWITTVQFLRQFQHIIGVTSLRTIDIIDEVHASFLAGEVLTTTVATKSQRSFARNDIPEIDAGIMIGLITREFSDTLKAHHLGHLGVGVHVVETILSL